MAVPEEWLPTTEPGLSANFHPAHSSQTTFRTLFHALIFKDIILNNYLPNTL